MGGIRGTWQEPEGIPMMATFHPSYLLRRNDNSTKRQVWEDLLLVMEDRHVSQRKATELFPSKN